MIRVDKGEFKLDTHNLIIHPDLSLSEFLAGDIPILNTLAQKKHGGFFYFEGQIDGLNAAFWIIFALEKVRNLHFWEAVSLYDKKLIEHELQAATKKSHEAYLVELNKWTEITSQKNQQQKERHDTWLQKIIGAPPPYEYESWGEINSGFSKDEEPEIWVRFKYDFGEEPDLKAYFEKRMEQRRRLAANPAKPFVPTPFPPGFSGKTNQ